MSRLAGLLVIALALLTGCEPERSAAQEQAQATVETFLALCEEGRTVAAERLLVEPVAERFVAADTPPEACREVLGFAPEASARAAKAHTNGGFSTVVVERPGEPKTEVELERLRGRWLIAGARPSSA